MDNNTMVVEEAATEKQKKKINWKKVFEYSLPALISIAICFFAMIFTGAYPFGKQIVGYIDVNDGLTPAYTYLWDILHGKANIFVAWDLGAGGSAISSLVLNGFLSPISWLIAIFPRASVMYGIAFLVIVKLALMATTAYICFKKFFPKVNSYVLLMFSLIWTFSGWTMVHWTNIGWLDLMILLPLLIMSLKKLEEEGKMLWFVIILSYLLMLSYYISYMILVGLVVVATVYIFTLSKNRKRTAALLFFGIIISILISMVAFIPSAVTSLQGHRFSGEAEASAHELYQYMGSKLAVLLMTGVPFVFFVKLLATYKKDKKNVLFFMISFIILTAGVLIEPINKMWHTGSYFSFPFRYSFNIIIFVIFGALYYINKYISNKEVVENQEVVKEETKKKYKFNILALLPAFVLGFILSLVAIVSLGATAVPYQKTGIATTLLFVLLFGSVFGIVECLLKIKNPKLKLGKLNGGILILILAVVQMFSLFTGFLTYNAYLAYPRITNAFKIDASVMEDGYKIKDANALYNHNFPYLTDYCSMSSWIHIAGEEQYQGYHMLGYNTFSTRLLSSGGTLMTDVLFGNKYIVSKVDNLNPAIYDKIDTIAFDKINKTGKIEKSEVYLYELKLNMQKVFVTDVDLTDVLEVKEDADFVENQNALFKALYGSVQDVMTKINSFDIQEVEGGYKVSVNVPAGEKLFLISNAYEYFDVNMNDMYFTMYNGLNDLGEGSSVVEFVVKEKYNREFLLENISFASFNTELFVTAHQNYNSGADVELKTNGSSLKIEIDNASNKQYALIPYTYLKNMVGENNGKELEVQTVFESFMFVELQEGDNNITISYEPQLIKPCLIITIVAIVLFVVFALLNWKFNLSDKKWVMWTGTVGACVVLLVVGFLVYAKPFVDFFILLFTGW